MAIIKALKTQAGTDIENSSMKEYPIYMIALNFLLLLSLSKFRFLVQRFHHTLTFYFSSSSSPK